MATIRIYKVAEVLGIPSHDIIDLLKREHGIEVKSASSTIEEIVAKQFAERTARERNLSLPAGTTVLGKIDAHEQRAQGRETSGTRCAAAPGSTAARQGAEDRRAGRYRGIVRQERDTTRSSRGDTG